MVCINHYALTYCFSVRWIVSYTLSLDNPKDASSFWKFDASIGFDFLTAGSLGLLIEDASYTADLSCGSTGNCTLATHLRMNENVLTAILEPGFFFPV